MNILFPSLSIAYLLILWNLTDFIPEYAELLGFSNLFQTNEYEQLKEKNFTLTYPQFLQDKFSSFFTRLLGCPFCLGFWLDFLFSIFVGFEYFFVIGFLSIFAYFIFLLVYKLNYK